MSAHMQAHWLLLAVTIALVHCRGRTLALALGCLLHNRYFKGEALLCS